MGSKTVVGSLKRPGSVQGHNGKKMKDDEPTLVSGSEVKGSSEEDDSRIVSDSDNNDIEDEDASEGEENASAEEEGISEEEEDASSMEEEGSADSDYGKENMSDSEEDVDMSDDDVIDNGGVQRQGKTDQVIDGSEGIDLTDSDDDNFEEDDDGETKKDSDDNDVKVAANPAWAQALAKILRTQKPTGKKAIVLSKARTIPAAEAAAARKVDEPDFEIIGEEDVKPKIKVEDVKPTEEELIAKRQRLAFCRVKQEKFDFNRERALTKIATRGVVQLFNAVRAEQKHLGSKLAEAHSTRMEDKLLKSLDKDSFLEHLTGKIRSQRVEDLEKKIKPDKDEAIALPKSWDELSKSVESGKDLHGWDRVIEIKDEPED